MKDRTFTGSENAAGKFHHIRDTTRHGAIQKLVEGWRYLTGHATTKTPFRPQKRSLASIIVELSKLADHFQVEEEKQNDLDRLLDDI